MSRHSPGREDELQEQCCQREMYLEMLESLERKIDPEEFTPVNEETFTAEDHALLRAWGIELPS